MAEKTYTEKRNLCGNIDAKISVHVKIWLTFLLLLLKIAKAGYNSDEFASVCWKIIPGFQTEYNFTGRPGLPEKI